jgi:hypothetical protein
MMIEGSGAGSGCIPLTKGSGSRRPINMEIRWIRIRIRIRNTGEYNPVVNHRSQIFNLSHPGSKSLMEIHNNSVDQW